MAGKIGQKVNRESSPRFKEYYHKNFPKLSIQECEEKARFLQNLVIIEISNIG